jgi:Flp pilus assembly protein TadG
MKHREERGANLVEMALILPLLLLLLAGVVDIGRAYHTYITIINAAREGARYGVNRPWDTSGIQTMVRNEAQNSNVNLSGATITVSNGGTGNPIRVTVQLQFPTLMGGILGINTIPIGSTCAFRIR